MCEMYNDYNYEQYTCAACACYACVQNAYILHTCILHVFCINAKNIYLVLRIFCTYALFFVFCTYDRIQIVIVTYVQIVCKIFLTICAKHKQHFFRDGYYSLSIVHFFLKIK